MYFNIVNICNKENNIFTLYMKCYIITRFSIYDYNCKSFKITRETTNDDYKSKLFDNKRLDLKFYIFEKMTIPSIVNQTNQDFIWFIYSSKYLPENYKQKLLNLTKNYSKIKVFFIESFSDFYRPPIIAEKFFTLRLDDDDSLRLDFIDSVNKYNFDEHENCIISHINGIKFAYYDDKITYGGEISYKKIALGLCAIGMNIYKCGNHNSIDSKYKVIYNDTPNMYYLFCSKYCDTNRSLNFSCKK